jgi:aminopeptidase N
MSRPAPSAARSLLLVAALASRALASAASGTGVDVLDYTFAIALGDATESIEGEATLLLRLDAATTSAVELDLVRLGEDGRGMTVREVIDGDGAELAFAHGDDRLRVELAEGTAPGDAGAERLRSLTVHYAGMPRQGFRIAENRHGERTFFSDNWPQGARHWLPTVDHPSDKALCSFVVTAPAHYQVVASGRLVEECDLAGGLRRTRWRTEAPIATKVMALGVARFVVHHYGDDVLGVPVEGWVFPADREVGLLHFARLPEMLRFFAGRLGAFPYAKLAAVQSTTRFGGMENASAVFLGEATIDAAAEGVEVLLAHEVAHQWFGDAVTERDWNELWLSEGFATYFAALYAEATYGRRRLEQMMERSRRRVLEWTAENPAGVVRPALAPPPEELLGAHVYHKGAWVLHMLRAEIGDQAFWRAMASYYARHRDETVGTDDLRRVVEEHAGRELGWFFDQWLGRPGHPVLATETRFEAATGEIEILVRQVQAGEPFRATLELEALGPDGRRSTVVALGERESRARVELGGPPVGLTLDPEVVLLFEEASAPAAESAPPP